MKYGHQRTITDRVCRNVLNAIASGIIIVCFLAAAYIALSVAASFNPQVYP